MTERRIFLGMPGYGRQTADAGRALWRASRDMDSVTVQYQNGSLLAQNFNTLWCHALNMGHDGRPPDYFAMLHDDIGVQDFWLDVLIDELEANKLDLLGVVVPIKDVRGLTSLALHEDGDNWRPAARLSMAEVYRLPETFTSEDVGRPLLLNTGCWVCKFNMAWATQVHFEINDAIGFNRATGRYVALNESEDWYFSRLCHELDLKIGATRKIVALHRGELDFHNKFAWGNRAFDTDSVSTSLLPEVDRDGFRLPGAPGWMTQREAKALWSLAKNKRVLEVGSYCGFSTVCIAQSASFVQSVDTHDGRGTPIPMETFSKLQESLCKYGVEDRVDCWIGEFKDFQGGEYDLIFIDGSHELEHVRSDIEHALPMLANGGLLAFHDYRSKDDPEVAVAVDELISAGGELLATYDTLAVVKPPASILMET